MIKFRTIGAYKNAVNVGNYKTSIPLKNGMLVTLNMAEKEIALPTESTAKGDIWLVMNRIDKPATNSPNEYTIEIGEFPRLFDVKSLRSFVLDMDMDQVSGEYSSLAVKDTLVAGTDGKLTKVASVDGYAVYFEIIEKTSFGGNGLAVRVVVPDLVSAAAGA